MTYEDRVKRIKNPDDIANQIRLAKAYMIRCKQVAERNGMMSDKIDAYRRYKAAESVLCDLRVNIFKLEDHLLKGA